MYSLLNTIIMYSIFQIKKVKHRDGRVEIIPSDTTVAFIADNLEEMSISLPITQDDEDAIWEFVQDREIFIGQDEAEGIHHPDDETDQVGLALDEFNCESGEYIDLEKFSKRVSKYLKETKKSKK